MTVTSGSSSLADHAYDVLRDRLVMLEIPPGAPLNEAALTAELGIGRTPLREALKRLQTDHLVDFFARRGTFAAWTNLAELKSLTEMRVILEPAGTRKAAELATAVQRQALTALAIEVSELGDTDPDARTLIEYDLKVHRSIYQLIENPHMRETLGRLGNLAARLWWSVIQELPSVADHIDGHRALLAAVAEGKPELAAQLAREHVTEFHRQLQGAVIGTDGVTVPHELRSPIK